MRAVTYADPRESPALLKRRFRIHSGANATRCKKAATVRFSLMWSRADVLGLFSNNVVSFSCNVVLSGLSFSINVVRKQRILSVRTVYVLGSLHLYIIGERRAA